MKNSSQSSDHSERPDRSVRQDDGHFSTGTGNEQAQLDALMKNGFGWDEAVRLMYFREHLYSNSEVQQRIANDHHMQFVRWLYEQGELEEM